MGLLIVLALLAEPDLRAETAAGRAAAADAVTGYEAALLDLLVDDHAPVRLAAARALARVGAPAEALDALFARLDTADEELALLLYESVAGIGAPAVPRLRAMLKGDDPEDLRHALRIARWMGPEAGRVAELVLDLCGGPDEVSARLAVDALERLAPWAAPVAPDIVERLLFAEDDAVRRMAAVVLGRIGPGATVAIPALETIRDGDDRALADAAAAALRRIEPPWQAAPPHPDLRKPHKLRAEAPASFRVRFETTRGPFVAEFVRAWSPHGVDRVWNLVQVGFFDGGTFFRVLEGRTAQFGIHASGKVSTAWQEANITVDERRESNVRGTISFAQNGPETRTTQLFVNLGDNTDLDAQGFTPVGRVVEGLERVDRLHAGYGDGPPRGTGPDANMVEYEGNVYLDREFPLLDRIRSARIETGEGGE